MSRFTKRMLLLATVVASLAMATASGAFATTQTDSTNPELQVTASLLSNGPNQDVATVGNWIFIRLSVQNLGPKQYVRLFPSGTWPNGALPDMSPLVLMYPGQRLGFAFAIPVFRFLPKGAYTLGLGALGTASLDPSWATASLTIS